MGERVTYEKAGRSARIRMDDGKANAMGLAMLSELHDAFDRAANERAVVVLSGRENIFSAGFDLKVFSGGDAGETRRMLRLGAAIASSPSRLQPICRRCVRDSRKSKATMCSTPPCLRQENVCSWKRTARSSPYRRRRGTYET